MIEVDVVGCPRTYVLSCNACAFTIFAYTVCLDSGVIIGSFVDLKDLRRGLSYSLRAAGGSETLSG